METINVTEDDFAIAFFDGYNQRINRDVYDLLITCENHKVVKVLLFFENTKYLCEINDNKKIIILYSLLEDISKIDLRYLFHDKKREKLELFIKIKNSTGKYIFTQMFKRYDLCCYSSLVGEETIDPWTKNDIDKA